MNSGTVRLRLGPAPSRRRLPIGVSSASLRQLGAANGGITFTCVPPGSGRRIAIDRDNNGVLDGDQH